MSVLDDYTALDVLQACGKEHGAGKHRTQAAKAYADALNGGVGVVTSWYALDWTRKLSAILGDELHERAWHVHNRVGGHRRRRVSRWKITMATGVEQVSLFEGRSK